MAKKNVMLNVVFLNGAEGSVGTATGGASAGSESKYDAVMMDGMTFRGNTGNSLPSYTIDTSKMTNMDFLFYGCSNVATVPPLSNTGNVKSMRSMFQNCSKLTAIPELDTSNVTDMGRMFMSCKLLTSIPKLDTSKVKSISAMFNYCSILTAIPELDTSNATNMSSMFQNCSKLTTIPMLDTSNATNTSSIFNSCSNLVFALVKNIGKSTLKTFDFSGATNWGTGGDENRQSLIDSLITYSYDRASAGMDTATIKLSANTKALLTEEEIAQITAKGFTIS